MKIRVLGSCVGGGLSQWNCGGENAVRAAGIGIAADRQELEV